MPCFIFILFNALDSWLSPAPRFHVVFGHLPHGMLRLRFPLFFCDQLSLREKPPRLDVIATDGTRGQMIWYDVGRDAVSLKQLADQYPVGLCVRARVKSIAHGGLISYTAIAQPDDRKLYNSCWHCPPQMAENSCRMTQLNASGV